MTANEFRASSEYADMMRKINSYSKGFKFTIPLYKMTCGQRNAWSIFAEDVKDKIELVADGWGFNDKGEFINTESTYIKR